MATHANIPEADWKTLRGMKEALLRRASARALEHVQDVMANTADDPYHTYLDLRRTLETEDRKMARMFDDMKRSNARLKLVEMFLNGILSPEDLEAFTAETREQVEYLAGVP